MSAIQMILHASEICADTNRNLNSVFLALTSEVGELAEELRIDIGQSYKAPGVDGVQGEAIDVLAATIDLIYLAIADADEDKVKAKLKIKLLKWLEKTGTVINPDDPYFGTCDVTTFDDLEDGFAAFGYDLQKYPNEYRICKCGLCTYQAVGSLSEVQVVFNTISLFDL